MRFPKEKIILTLIVLIFLFLITTVAVFSSNKEPSLSAYAAALYEPVTKTFILTKNANERLPFASTTKIMTALVAIESFPLDKEVTVVKEACGIEGSSLYLKPGEVLSMRDLLVALILRSANDAAAAIAYAVAGGIGEFAEMMNRRAAVLGLNDTHFANPHGLDDKEHYTTAKELALIAAEAMSNPEFKSISAMRKEKIVNSDGEVRLITNHNKLLTLYEGANGVKTGFTKKSGRCLVGSAERDGLTLITVTINAPDDWNDHKKLFEHGFTTMEARTLLCEGELSYSIPVLESKSATIRVTNRESFTFVTQKDNSSFTHEVVLPRYTVAPISKGEALGRVIFYKDGEVIGEVSLVAEEQILKKENGGLFRRFKK